MVNKQSTILNSNRQSAGNHEFEVEMDELRMFMEQDQNKGFGNPRGVDKGRLYIVATPIGHLGDMTQRAIDTLKAVDFIVAEDTRHSQPMLKHFSIQKPIISLHEHNERDKTAELLSLLEKGKSLALISDAGTPLISDPGYFLVRQALISGFQLVPIPGASALLAALSVSGLPTDQFCFQGFLPSKKNARHEALIDLARESRTLIFYEAPHRLLATLEAMKKVFGDDREVVLARELTKTFETIRRGSLAELETWAAADPNQQRGEMVLLLAGYKNIKTENLKAEELRILKILSAELPLTQAARLTAKITGVSKRALYEAGLDSGDENI